MVGHPASPVSLSVPTPTPRSHAMGRSGVMLTVRPDGRVESWRTTAVMRACSIWLHPAQNLVDQVFTVYAVKNLMK
jgi:hypothetical protein